MSNKDYIASRDGEFLEWSRNLVPELEVDTSVPRRHKVFYRAKGSARRGKPEHVKGIEIRWAILDHYPQSIDELIHSGFDTASPWVNDFDEADRGLLRRLVGSPQRRRQRPLWGNCRSGNSLKWVFSA